MDTTILICCTTDEEPLVPSKPMWCGTCGADLWVSEAMVPVVAAGEMVPTCALCAAGLLENESDSEMRIHPNQRPGLAQMGTLAEIEAEMRQYNRAQRRKRRERG